jgi:endoglucanase
VRLTGLSWFGLETANYAPHGLWTRSMDGLLDQVVQLGFNVLRLPFCNQMLDPGSTPNGIDYNKNPDLQGLKPVDILDKLVAKAGQRKLRVFLDRHRPDAGSQSALWYTDAYSEQRWIDDWKLLAARYKGNPTVIGADLHNEPHDPATWGSGDPKTDWRLAAQKAGNAILGVNPSWLIIVEGVSSGGGNTTWWGGHLGAAGQQPVVLSIPGRLVYSPHDYPKTVYNQPWFSDPTYPQNLPPLWDSMWGYLAKGGIAPVLVGEFGTRYQDASDKTWLKSIVKHIGDNGLSFTFWCLNPNSGDTGGILKDDWQTVETDKHAVLKPVLAPLLP